MAHTGCPVPNDWPQAEINRVLDLTENALKNSIQVDKADNASACLMSLHLPFITRIFD
jgi:hypothetical protein